MTKQRYSTDLTDAQWKLIRPLLSRETRGRPRRVRQRRIINALCYVVSSGVQWRLLPREFPKWTLVYYYFRRWNRCDFWRRLYHLLRVMLRHKMGRHKHPTAGCQDSQSVKTAAGAGVRGFDCGKKIKGRKRHVLSDTQGLPLEILVTPADVSDTQGARRLWQKAGRRRGSTQKLRLVWVDGGYKRSVQEWCAAKRGVRLQVVEKEPGQRGFTVQKRRWVIERTFGWFSAQRRLVKDYQVLTLHSEGLLWFTAARVVLRRLA